MGFQWALKSPKGEAAQNQAALCHLHPPGFCQQSHPNRAHPQSWLQAVPVGSTTVKIYRSPCSASLLSLEHPHQGNKNHFLLDFCQDIHPESLLCLAPPRCFIALFSLESSAGFCRAGTPSAFSSHSCSHLFSASATQQP